MIVECQDGNTGNSDAGGNSNKQRMKKRRRDVLDNVLFRKGFETTRKPFSYIDWLTWQSIMILRRIMKKTSATLTTACACPARTDRISKRNQAFLRQHSSKSPASTKETTTHNDLIDIDIKNTNDQNCLSRSVLGVLQRVKRRVMC